MLAALALSFLEERVVYVEYERGLIGWILIGHVPIMAVSGKD